MRWTRGDIFEQPLSTLDAKKETPNNCTLHLQQKNIPEMGSDCHKFDEAKHDARQPATIHYQKTIRRH